MDSSIADTSILPEMMQRNARVIDVLDQTFEHEVLYTIIIDLFLSRHESVQNIRKFPDRSIMTGSQGIIFFSERNLSRL